MEIGVNKEFYEHLKELFFEELSSSYKRGHRKPLILTKDSFEIIAESTCFDLEYDDDDFETPEEKERHDNTLWSYIQFRIKELPQWRFGVDFDIDFRTKSNYWYKSGVWYAQYERFIDKFKASRSQLIGDISYQSVVTSSDPDFCIPEELSVDFDFLECIIDKPARAFCTDMGYDQYDYLSAPKAYYEMWKTVLKDILSNAKLARINRYILRPVKNVLKDIPNAFIKDEEDCLPRYTIYIPESYCKTLDGYDAEDNEYDGFYDLDDTFFGVAKLDKALAEVNKRKEYVKKKYKSGWWYDQTSDNFYIYVDHDGDPDWVNCAHRTDCENCKFYSDTMLKSGGCYCQLRADMFVEEEE